MIVARLLAASLVLLIGFALTDRGEFLRTAHFQLLRLDTERPLWNASVYLGTYLGTVLAVAIALCHRKSVRIPAIALTLGAACAHVGVAAVNGVGFTHHEASLLLTESEFLGSAMRFFLPSYGPAVASALLAGALLAWLALRVGPRLRSWPWLIVPLVMSLAAHQVVAQTFGRVYEFPSPFRLVLLTTWGWQHRLPVYAEREAPYFEPKQAPLANHVILIVDESVSGHWFAVNGASVATTPWLSERPDGVFNYGIASAISNLSASSNLVLQTGLRPDALPDRELRALRGPNVFSYMSQAGFYTALIDAQTYSDAPPNLMTGFDLQRIDRVVRLRELEPGLPEYAVDFAAIPRIRALIETHSKSFAYVIKTGAHLPYHDKSPPEQRPFQNAAKDERGEVRSSYLDAIRWTTDRFLQELTSELEASDREVLVVYTSDHGQSLPDDPGVVRRVSPHATVLDPPAAQASVPLLVLAFGTHTRAMIKGRFMEQLVDQASAFEIFPTVLQAVGYAVEDTSQVYPPSLFESDAIRPPRRFVSGNIFGANGGAYVLNPGLGDDCLMNDFDVSSVRAPEP